MISVILTLLICYIALFIIAYFKKDNSYVDIFWGAGFFIVALILFLQGNHFDYQSITLILIFLWSLRIILYIGSKKLHHPGEDKRYAIWRETWKYFYLRSFFQVYILQMMLMLAVSIPLFVIFSGSVSEISPYILYTGLSIAIFGLIFEGIADWQLSQFMKMKKPGEIFTTGLYRYSRHPNYFGESMFWLGISIMGFSISVFSLIGWICITFLLLFVSGIPPLERRYKDDEAYKEYAKKTSIFIPWFPK